MRPRAFLAAAIGAALACGVAGTSSGGSDVFLEKIPRGLSVFVPVPADNPLTPEKVALGRRLFFDKQLSRDGTVACASCHRPERAFAVRRGRRAARQVASTCSSARRDAPFATACRRGVCARVISDTIYDWLVVAGARAKYKGSGTINGTGNYGFMLTAIDGQINGGGGADKFRIKIWDKNNGDAIVYDNHVGAGDNAVPTTLLGGGSIVIHKGG